MRNSELIATLKRVGITVGASLVSYIALCAVISQLYAMLWGHQEQMTYTVLSISKTAAQGFMFEFIWIPLKWVAVTIGIIVASAVILVVPVAIFRAIYVNGNKSL